jgi:hypothetical protein
MMAPKQPLVTSSLTGDQHAKLKTFLFPRDGKEASALALCGRRAGDRRYRLAVREIHKIPYHACSKRTESTVTWSTDVIVPLLERATYENLSIIKIHSHPGGYPKFSETDDVGDRRLLPGIHDWIETDIPHGSVVMPPDGQMFGRVLSADHEFSPLACIGVVGDDLHFWYADKGNGTIPSFAASHAQVFGQGTIERLRRLSIAVVGCSGTGSPVVEQLARLGAGELVLVDDDHMEDRNANRILNSIMEDARLLRPKVEVLAEAIQRMGFGTKVVPIKKNLWNPDVIREVAQCDVLFGCMDTVDGRFLLNSPATYYTLPYFDLGVRLAAIPSGPKKGALREVCGSIHYIQPGRSSLMSRGLFTMQQVAEAGLRRNDPQAHAQQIRDGYIAGVQEQEPTVIFVNMHFAALSVNELLVRLHLYREEPNRKFAQVEFSFSSMELFSEPEEGVCSILEGEVGKGDTEPLLDLMELAERQTS